MAIFHARIINKPITASLKTGLMKMVKWLIAPLAKKGKGRAQGQKVQGSAWLLVLNKSFCFQEVPRFATVGGNSPGSPKLPSIPFIPFLGHSWCWKWAGILRTVCSNFQTMIFQAETRSISSEYIFSVKFVYLWNSIHNSPWFYRI